MIDDEEKIPYDNEPITRYKTSGMVKESKRNGSPRRSSKALYTFFALLFLINCGLVVSLFSISKKVSDLSDENAIYNLSIEGAATDLSYATAKGMTSTVCVSASTSNNANNAKAFFSSDMSSRGSGVVMQIDRTLGDAYIITNMHVVKNASSAYDYIWIMFWDSLEPIPATFVGGSNSYDIAVLFINNSEQVKTTSANPVEVTPSDKVVAGQSCIAIGNSRARNLRITTGVVSVEEDVLTGEYLDDSFFISHSADVNSGNSGGGLYDAQGKLLGIVNAKFNDTSSSGYLIYGEVIHGMYYAIPSSIAYSIAQNIIANNGLLKKANLGLVYKTSYSIIDKSIKVTNNNYVQTQYTLVVSQNTGSFRSGDILSKMTYTYAGETVEVDINRLFAIENNVFNLRNNDTVKFEVKRGNSIVEVVFNNLTTTTVS